MSTHNETFSLSEKTRESGRELVRNTLTNHAVDTSLCRVFVNALKKDIADTDADLDWNIPGNQARIAFNALEKVYDNHPHATELTAHITGNKASYSLALECACER